MNSIKQRLFSTTTNSDRFRFLHIVFQQTYRTILQGPRSGVPVIHVPVSAGAKATGPSFRAQSILPGNIQ